LGWIKFRKSKEVKGEIINVTVARTNTDEPFISIAVKEAVKELPRVLKKYERKIARLNRSLARKGF